MIRAFSQLLAGINKDILHNAQLVRYILGLILSSSEASELGCGWRKNTGWPESGSEEEENLLGCLVHMVKLNIRIGAKLY